jgi:hypothetical protein
MAMTDPMQVAPALLLAALFTLNLSAPAAALAAPVLHERHVRFSSPQVSILDFDARRASTRRPAAALMSNTLPLLGIGLLVLLAVRILRSRR